MLACWLFSKTDEDNISALSGLFFYSSEFQSGDHRFCWRFCINCINVVLMGTFPDVVLVDPLLFNLLQPPCVAASSVPVLRFGVTLPGPDVTGCIDALKGLRPIT